ncbi:hypothetical protein DFH06DRAFT_1190377 [Mycena polygramma]|nr:hypothetical protein DFH06DRAFT_1190377 [Mycena polygramma]
MAQAGHARHCTPLRRRRSASRHKRQGHGRFPVPVPVRCSTVSGPQKTGQILLKRWPRTRGSEEGEQGNAHREGGATRTPCGCGCGCDDTGLRGAVVAAGRGSEEGGAGARAWGRRRNTHDVRLRVRVRRYQAARRCHRCRRGDSCTAGQRRDCVPQISIL